MFGTFAAFPFQWGGRQLGDPPIFGTYGLGALVRVPSYDPLCQVGLAGYWDTEREEYVCQQVFESREPAPIPTPAPMTTTPWLPAWPNIPWGWLVAGIAGVSLLLMSSRRGTWDIGGALEPARGTVSFARRGARHKG